MNEPTPTLTAAELPDLTALYAAWTLKQYGPPRLLVDASYTIIQSFNQAERYLQAPVESQSANLLDKVLPALSSDLRAALDQAFHKGERAKSRWLATELNHVAYFIRLQVGPVNEPGFPKEYIEVVFEEHEASSLSEIAHTAVAPAPSELPAQRPTAPMATHDPLSARTEAQDHAAPALPSKLIATPHKQAEEQIAYQAFLLEHIQGAVIAIDNQQYITLWNRGAEALYGWPQTEVLGRPLIDVIRTNATLEQRQQMQTDLNEHRYQVQEVLHQHRDGRLLVVQSVASVLRTTTGAIIGYMSINTDITEHKQTEADQRLLAILAEKFRMATDARALVAETVRLVGEHLQVERCLLIEVNPAQDRGVILGQYGRALPPLAEFRLSDYRAATRATLRAGRTVVTHDAARNASPMDRADGVDVLPDASSGVGVPFLREGAWRGLLSVVNATPRQWQLREVHLLKTTAERVWLTLEKLRLDVALRANEERLRQITDNLPGLISVVNNQEAYEFVNQNYQRWLGLDPARMIGRPVSKVRNETAYRFVQPYLQRAFAGEQVTFEDRMTSTEGAVIDVLITLVPRRTVDGTVTGCYILAMDISERKQAEIALQQSNAILNAVLESTNDAIFVRDLAGRYLLVNSAGAEQVQRTKAAIIGKTYAELFPPAEVAAMRNEDRSVLEQGLPQTLEHITKHTGNVRHWHTLKMPLRNAAGEIIGLISSARDFTEHKQIEEALRVRETELRVITDNIPGLISYVDSEQCYRFANAVYEEWYKRSRDQMIGQHMRTALGETIYAQVQPYIERALQGEFVQFEATLAYPKNTQTIWATYVPNVDSQGVVHGFYALVTDISERKRAEEQLRASEERLRLALEGGGLGIWEWQLPTDTSTWTEQEFALFGLPPDTPITHELFASLLHPAERANVQAVLDRVTMQGGDYAIEYRIIRPDGQVRWLAEHGIALCNAQGQPVRLLGVNFDITERKAAEQALQQFNERLDQQVKERTTELTKRLQELDQFAHVASHDLKAPLRAIDHLAQWISDDASDLLPPASRGHLEKIQGRIKRMEKLLDDLLAYSRADRYEYSQETLNVALLLDDIIRLVTPPQGFAVSVQTPMPVLVTQKVPLETVLRNLINNAIKHHDRSDGQVQVSARDLGAFIEFSVSDDGPGIAPQFHERIFQVFQTLKSRDQVEGSGIGLAIVKKLVEGRNGQITVISAPGQGATFRFTWPKGSA